MMSSFFNLFAAQNNHGSQSKSGETDWLIDWLDRERKTERERVSERGEGERERERDALTFYICNSQHNPSLLTPQNWQLIVDI